MWLKSKTRTEIKLKQNMVYTVFVYFDQLKKLVRKCLVKVEAIWIKLGISPPNALKLKQCLLATEGQKSFITYSHIRQKIKTSTYRDDLFRQKWKWNKKVFWSKIMTFNGGSLDRIIAVNMTLISPVKLTSPYSAQYGVMTIHNKILISFIIFLEKYYS